MPVNEKAAEAAEDRLSGLPSPGTRRWVGVGPCSKMPAKTWPAERFAAVVVHLIREFDVWPIVLGGAGDADMGERMVRYWGRGYNAAGVLSVSGAAEILRQCALYVGNDTGTMHLAAAAGTRCVAVFSARDHPGAWDPLGIGHHVIRHAAACDGCMLETCAERGRDCLHAISVEQVGLACSAVLENRQQGEHPARVAGTTDKESRQA